MTKKSNGHDLSYNQNGNIVKLPTLAERDRARREKEKLKRTQEKQWQKQYKAERKDSEPPFLNIGNITPFVKFLTVAFIVVQLILAFGLDSSQTLRTFLTLGFVPGAFTGTADFFWYTPLTLITHMFIHGGWMHLVFNLVMTLAIGLMYEREYGTRNAVIFFFLCGFAGAATFFAFTPFSTAPVIGASGGISGFFGAALIMLHQRGQMGALHKKLGNKGPWPIIILWTFIMIIIGLISGPGMAWQNHIGGFLAGALLLRGQQKGIIKF